MQTGTVNTSAVFKSELVYERIFYRNPYSSVILTAKIKGSISKKQLASALLVLQNRHRLLNSRIECDDNGAAWFLSEKALEPLINEVQIQSTDSWVQYAIQEQQVPFDLDKGPLIRYLLLKSDSSTDLLIICHHTICDGLSLVYLLRDIMYYISNTDCAIEELPLPSTVYKGVIPGSASESLLAKVVFGSVNKDWKKTKTEFTNIDYDRIYKMFWKNEKLDVALRVLGQLDTALLIEKCISERVTVNSAICTAFIIAQNKIQGKCETFRKNISMAVNIRNRLINDPGEVMGVFAAGIKLDVGKMNKDFWNNARYFNRIAKEQLASDKKVFQMTLFNMIDPTLMDAMYFCLYDGFKNKAALKLTKLLGYNEKNVGLGFTNLGKLGIPADYTNYYIDDIHFIPPSMPNVEKIVGISTFNGKMNICIPYLASKISSVTVSDIMDRAFKLLNEAVRI